MSIITKVIDELVAEISNKGCEINGTKEIVGKQLNINIKDVDLTTEEIDIVNYYTKIGINTQVIRSLEHNLYEFIYRGLKQSVEQLFYFDATQNYTSRRFTFSTTDCISHVQLLYRSNDAHLFMHIRSTDVRKLLPWDLLFSFQLINRVLIECRFPTATNKYIHITIGSAHYYLHPKTMY